MTLNSPVYCVWQGRIEYSLIGDYPAQSFFQIDPFTGLIRLTSSLRRQFNYLSFYTARVKAIDSERPTRSGTATVGISVFCNPGTPVFNPCLPTTIPESTPVGTTVLNVTATDSDNVCAFYV